MEANEYMLASTKEKESKSENKDDDNKPLTSGCGTVELYTTDVSDNNEPLYWTQPVLQQISAIRKISPC